MILLKASFKFHGFRHLPHSQCMMQAHQSGMGLIGIWMREVAEMHTKQCQEAGQPFVVMYVEEENKSNTSKKIRVKDVVRPYAVLDDLSYKISKAMKSTTRERILQDLERSSEMFGDATEFMSEPELAQIQVVSQTGMSKVPTA